VYQVGCIACVIGFTLRKTLAKTEAFSVSSQNSKSRLLYVHEISEYPPFSSCRLKNSAVTTSQGGGEYIFVSHIVITCICWHILTTKWRCRSEYELTNMLIIIIRSVCTILPISLCCFIYRITNKRAFDYTVLNQAIIVISCVITKHMK
jgi:hypothetical protein